tara:strand:+ start:5421 stop:5981 length:561 start_codon:yes stop_codon:yes gene_type:complete
MPIPYQLITKYNQNKICIETGTFKGEGIGRFLQSNMFDKIYSIDINETYVERAKQIYRNYSNVNVICGDSGVILEDIIKDIEEPITFWLDAHHCGSDSGCSDKYISPVQHELELIKNHPLAHKHIIMIDDINYFSESNIEINKKRHPTKEPGYILKSELIDKLKSINENINIEFLNIENGICVAYP